LTALMVVTGVMVLGKWWWGCRPPRPPMYSRLWSIGRGPGQSRVAQVNCTAIYLPRWWSVAPSSESFLI